MAEFVSELRSLAEFCNFGANLEEMLPDRLVCGIQNTHIQKRLLGEKTLTFSRALELSQGLEIASNNAKELAQVRVPEVSSNTVPVHAVKSSTRRKQSRAPERLQREETNSKEPPRGTCFSCGQTGHLHSECYFHNTKCHKCGKVGHIQKACQSRPGREYGYTAYKKANKSVHC